jgi:hypothetical protein
MAGSRLGLENFYFRNKDNLLARTLADNGRNDVREPLGGLSMFCPMSRRMKAHGHHRSAVLNPRICRAVIGWRSGSPSSGMSSTAHLSHIGRCVDKPSAVGANRAALPRDPQSWRLTILDPRALTQSIDAMVIGLCCHLLMYPNWITAKKRNRTV